jgi:hypothetical protein
VSLRSAAAAAAAAAVHVGTILSSSSSRDEHGGGGDDDGDAEEEEETARQGASRSAGCNLYQFDVATAAAGGWRRRRDARAHGLRVSKVGVRHALARRHRTHGVVVRVDQFESRIHISG